MTVSSAYNKYRQDVIQTVQRRYAKELFGTPPIIKDKRLQGGTPPDTKRLSRLLL